MLAQKEAKTEFAVTLSHSKHPKTSESENKSSNIWAQSESPMLPYLRIITCPVFSAVIPYFNHRFQHMFKQDKLMYIYAVLHRPAGRVALFSCSHELWDCDISPHEPPHTHTHTHTLTHSLTHKHTQQSWKRLRVWWHWIIHCRRHKLNWRQEQPHWRHLSVDAGQRVSTRERKSGAEIKWLHPSTRWPPSVRCKVLTKTKH